MRKSIRKPVKPEAVPTVVEKLATFLETGHNPNDSLTDAIVGSYQGLFPSKGNGAARSNGQSWQKNEPEEQLDYFPGEAQCKKA